MDPIDVVARDDEHLGRRVRADPEGRDHGGCDRLGECRQEPLMLLDLDLELLPSTGQTTERMLGRRERARDGPRAESGTALDESDLRKAIQLLTKPRRS